MEGCKAPQPPQQQQQHHHHAPSPAPNIVFWWLHLVVGFIGKRFVQSPFNPWLNCQLGIHGLGIWEIYLVISQRCHTNGHLHRKIRLVDFWKASTLSDDLCLKIDTLTSNHILHLYGYVNCILISNCEQIEQTPNDAQGNGHIVLGSNPIFPSNTFILEVRITPPVFNHMLKSDHIKVLEQPWPIYIVRITKLRVSVSNTAGRCPWNKHPRKNKKHSESANLRRA